MAPLNISDVSKYQSESGHRRTFLILLATDTIYKERHICFLLLHTLGALAMRSILRPGVNHNKYPN